MLNRDKGGIGLIREKNTFRFHDFEKIPHLVLGGATRYGKSNFINSMITSLLHSNPEHVKLFLVDLKGGIELCDYEHITQTVSIAYEPQEALNNPPNGLRANESDSEPFESHGKKESTGS